MAEEVWQRFNPEEEFKKFLPIREFTMMIQDIIRRANRGKAPPNIHYRIDIATNDAGWGHIQFQIRRKDDRMPFDDA